MLQQRASRRTTLTLLLAFATPCAADALDISSARLVDLTHTFDATTVYWPTAPSGFALSMLTDGPTDGGYHYAAGVYQAPEHGGTHLDAPSHFHEGGLTAERVPLERLVAPAVVIDVSGAAAGDPDYELQLSDVMVFETRHGSIAPGTIVLVRTGWSSRWPDRGAYLGSDTPGDASGLHFPGFGSDAMKLLVEERRVAAIGIDTASLDPGNSRDFRAHRVAAAAGVPGFENLTNLDQLPPRGAVVVALPMKIGGGSGAPLRAVALVPND